MSHLDQVGSSTVSTMPNDNGGGGQGVGDGVAAGVDEGAEEAMTEGDAEVQAEQASSRATAQRVTRAAECPPGTRGRPGAASGTVDSGDRLDHKALLAAKLGGLQ
jgi:hypothetical protein